MPSVLACASLLLILKLFSSERFDPHFAFKAGKADTWSSISLERNAPIAAVQQDRGPRAWPSLGLCFGGRSGPGHWEEGQAGVSPDRRYQEPPPQRDSAVFDLEAAMAMILRFWEHWLPLLATQNEETFGIFLDVFPKYVLKIEKQVQGHSVWQTNQVYCKKSCLVFVSSSWWMRSFGL